MENKRGPEVYVGAGKGPEIYVGGESSAEQKPAKKENIYLQYVKYLKRAAEENRLEERYNEEKSKLEERLKQCTEKDDKESADSFREDIIMLEEACRIVKNGGNKTADKICPKCGKGYDPAISFCTKCGSKLIEIDQIFNCMYCNFDLSIIEHQYKSIRFCPSCGRELTTTQREQLANTEQKSKAYIKYCEKCKKIIPDGEQFCGSCGSALKEGKCQNKNCEEPLVQIDNDFGFYTFCPVCGNENGQNKTSDSNVNIENQAQKTNDFTKKEQINKNKKKTYNYEKLKPGDIIELGFYPNVNPDIKEPIEWIILEKFNNGMVFLLSKFCIDTMPYNDRYMSISWENSSIRKWLNYYFYNTAFLDYEKKAISETPLKNNEKPKFGIKGNDTLDKVFLLSIEEFKMFLKDPAIKKAIPTAFAKSKGAWTGADKKGSAQWWLRSPGEISNYASFVVLGGHIDNEGKPVNTSNIAVRPALVLNVKHV